ncbi:MAG: carboxylating nicotinate-nucleotide diphosphorylase [Bacteroidetes bacterium]|nr:carboxylating nicotinate-nucleotide diphosphorylase [Bacteroidota bacterium]MCH8524287.1 carboxylating nicotinate-nucleotide diphosphorylase [Balneolales bacterium]
MRTPLHITPELDELIDLALREDIGFSDITTAAVYSGLEVAAANLIAKQNGVIAGLEVAQKIVEKVDPSVVFLPNCNDGEKIERGSNIASIQGAAGSILTVERTVLNFMQRMSGIATLVNKYAEAISHTKAKVLDTRKTIPGHRLTDKWAVRLGGGENHRIGLYDRYLIKENHIVVAGGVGKAIEACLNHRESLAAKPEIEVEVTNLDELNEALTFSSDIDYIMLDNMSNDLIREAVKRTAGRCKLEASGNVTIETIADIAETGVDFISVGAITHSVKAMDISLIFR